MARKDKGTNNNLPKTTQKTKQHELYKKPGVINFDIQEVVFYIHVLLTASTNLQCRTIFKTCSCFYSETEYIASNSNCFPV